MPSRSLPMALATLMVAGMGLGGLHASALQRVSPYLTRAEAVTMLLFARPEGVPARTTQRTYTDVYTDDWFARPLLAGADMRLVDPDATRTKLLPFGSVNRATFLKMLAIAFALPTNTPHTYGDVPTYTWYAPYAGIAREYGLFVLDRSDRLEPNRLLTQDEAARALERFVAARSDAEEAAAQQTAIAQASGRVQLYTIISTKRLRVVLVPDAGDALEKAPEPLPFFGPQTSSKAVAPSIFPAPIPQTIDTARTDVLRLVNAVRATHTLPPLTMNIALQTSAQTYADAMATEGFFGHTDPDGHTLRDRVAAVHYFDDDFSDDCQCVKGFVLGENLARGQKSAQEAVDAWMASPSHRDAMLGSDFTDIGVGLHGGIWVQHFGGILTPDSE